jgi:tRNA G18 (ribose-2'-O)-methylase SpoU
VRVERLDGPDDPRVADYRGVSEPVLLRERGLFVAEGRLVVRRLIEDRRWRIRSLLLSEAALESLGAARALVPADTPVFLCPLSDFTGLTGYHIHRGCLALGERRADPDVDALAAASRTLLVLEGVANADNVGGAFRNAAAFGVDAVLLSPTCGDPLYRKAIRTSMGATLRTPFARLPDWPSALDRARHAGFAIVALTPRAPADDLATIARAGRPARLLLVAGNEGAGISPDVERRADIRLRIPVRPEVDSLNVAVAVGIALHALQSGYTV